MKNTIILITAFLLNCHSVELPIDYKALNKLNEQAVDMVEKTASMCSDPRVFHGPHISAKMTYFANDKAVNVKKGEIFPIGAIIVKEKVGQGEAPYVDIVTIMEKVAIDGTAKDWRYSVYSIEDGIDLSEKFQKEMPKSCIDCHARYSNDYVSEMFWTIATVHDAQNNM